MKKISYQWYLIVADALLTLVSIMFSLMLRLEIVYPDRSLFGYYLRMLWPFILLAVIVRPFIFYVTGIYRRIWRYATTRDFMVLWASVTAGSVMLFIITVFIMTPRYIPVFPRSLPILEWLISLVLLGGLRVIIKVVEHYPGDINWKKTIEISGRRVIIVGAGHSGTNVARELMKNPQIGRQPIAFLDDDPKKIGMTTLGIRIYGPLIKLSEHVRELNIDEVIIAIPSAAEQIIKNIQSMCRNSNIPYVTVPFFSAFMEGAEGSQSTTSAPSSSLLIPMSLPDITPEEITAVVKVIQSRNLSIGSQTEMFEKLIAEQAGSSYAVAVINGTSALHMCMIAAGIEEGDEVITTPFSFISSSNCILYQKATPVFVDIDPESLNIDPSRIEQAITPKTKAIVVVDVFGQPADMDPIMDIAEKHNLIVIEDACEAIGAEYNGRRVGAIGKAGTFAFYPNKQMTTGEGAAIVTNDEKWDHLFRSLRNQGRDIFDGWLNHSRLGYNYRISELNAALGVVQLKRIDELLKRRDAVAQEYNRTISDVPDVKPLPIVSTTTRMSWFVYVVRLDKVFNRDIVIDRLGNRGIPARPYFAPIHLQSFYSGRFGYKKGDFPVAEAAGESIIALPFHGNMKTEEIGMVCKELRGVLSVLKGQ